MGLKYIFQNTLDRHKTIWNGPKLFWYLKDGQGIRVIHNFILFSCRYYVIVHPLKAQYLCTISKAKKTILLTWLSAFILAIPILLGQVSEILMK